MELFAYICVKEKTPGKTVLDRIRIGSIRMLTSFFKIKARIMFQWLTPG